MQVELICADAFDPEHGLVAHGPVDHAVADPVYCDEVHRRGGATKEHRIQKPLWLMEAVLWELADRGERVADPFAGSGMTLVAAVRLGRAARGWERVEPWARAAQRWIASARSPLGLLERPRLRTEQLELEDA